jgi:outer membrane protein assembly factor BamB
MHLFRSLLPLLCVAVLAAAGCRRKQVPVERDPTPSDAALRPAERRLLLGKVVDVHAHHVERTLVAEPPAIEIADARVEHAYILDRAGALRAFVVADGRELWSVTPKPVCRRLLQDERRVFCVTANDVVAYDKATPAAHGLVSSPKAIADALAVGEQLVVLFEKGDISVIDPGTGAVRAIGGVTPAAVPKGSGLGAGSIVAAPTGDGICTFAIVESTIAPLTFSHEVACYDLRLTKRWSNNLTVPQEARALGVQQLGPRYLVLATYQWAYTSAHARSRVVRLSDGHVLDLDGKEVTATLDGPNGALVALVSRESLLRPDGTDWPPAAGQPPSLFFAEDALAVYDGRRLALHARNSNSLLGVDGSSGKVLWKVQSELPHSPTLELIGEDLLLRATNDDAETTTSGAFIYDAQKGTLRYRDVRSVRKSVH